MYQFNAKGGCDSPTSGYQSDFERLSEITWEFITELFDLAISTNYSDDDYWRHD